MEEKGWIKLHRKLLENPIANKSAYINLWITLLLTANHKEKKMMWNGETIIIHSGQLITGRKALSEQTGIPETTIERILKYLENEHQIGQQKTSKYRLITIVNWHSFQKVDIISDNKRTTNGQQTDTNKNDKNVKNDKKEILAEASSAWKLEDKLKEMETNKGSYLDIIATFIREKGFAVENSKQLSNVITRYCRTAKKLSGAYSDKDIYSAIDQIKQDNSRRKPDNQIDWTLETIYKYLTK